MIETEMYDFISTVEEKWNEVELLWNMVNEAQKNNNERYRVLYKSCIVFTVATFEGLIKETVKSYILDINNNINFKDLSKDLKKIYIEKKFLTTENKIINILFETLDTLDKTSYKLDFKVFLEPNKNPSPKIIDKYTNNLGIKNFFHLLYNSDIENIAFSGTKIEIEILYNEIKDYLLSKIKKYPYHIDEKYKLLNSETKPKATLYEEFINDFLLKRHKVAHGLNMDDIEDGNKLLIDILKIKIIYISFVYIICKKTNN